MKKGTTALRMLALAATVTGVPVLAHAQDDAARAREHYVKATKAFELGLFEESISEYAQAYKLKDDPALLYNLGQANRLARHPAEALHFYKMYLSKVTDAVNRSEVQTKIAALERLIEQQRLAENIPPDRPLLEEGASRSSEPPSSAAARRTPSPARGGDTSAGHGKKVAGLALLGSGLALLVAGVALESAAAKTTADLAQRYGAGEPYNPIRESQYKTYTASGSTLLAVGGAAAIVGTAITIWGYREAKVARSRLSVAPVLSQKMAALAIGLTI
jgi:hypothetical protein